MVYESTAFANPPSPGLVFGGAPWAVAHGKEIFNGIIRGIRIYNTSLADSDLSKEICAPLSSAAGLSSSWYLKMNPDPANLACDPIPNRSTAGPTPVWSTAKKATLWKA